MKVFISWSGDLSKQVAELLNSWIENVLQGIDTWISGDMDKGTIWFSELIGEIKQTNVGILCLTRQNVKTPWLLFEAGGLNKGLTTSRVCPFLVNLNHAELEPPLSFIHGTLPNKEDMLKLIKTINTNNGEKILSEERLQKAFDKWWDDFDSKFKAILTNYKPKEEYPARPSEEILEEILGIVRSLQRTSLQSHVPSLNDVLYNSIIGKTRNSLADYVKAADVLSGRSTENENLEGGARTHKSTS